MTRVLSDLDNDGKLTCDEFCIAMHLVDLVKAGKTLTPKLPPELLPGKPMSGSFPGPIIPAPGVGKYYTFNVTRFLFQHKYISKCGRNITVHPFVFFTINKIC